MSEEKPDKLSPYWAPGEPGPVAQKGYEGWVEEQIQAAMAEGKFNNLPGKGKPLGSTWEHPWEEREWIVAHILSNAHVLPEWVVLDREINEEIAWLKAHPGHPERQERIVRLNRKIDHYNLTVPAVSMQKVRYRE